ncbi:hypothetical protein [Sphingobium sp. WCS2017Hpa-17]|uniref:hypothetical protein n=1 Tax=Sphingobium sp. WCS2017Hpa-17 TaxID=3073638 RepID=UPI00288A7E83|nr:hypothetical protein [Sphingobium sp. WCS2017Hpa-17]
MTIETPLIEQLAALSPNWPSRTPADFPPGTLIAATADHPGVGIRVDAFMPYAGTVRLIHWIISPYDDVPPGIVEDCNAARIGLVSGKSILLCALVPLGNPASLPTHRSARRNLARAGNLMGLRGWDIPHDRVECVMDIESGKASLSVESGRSTDALWHAAWQLSLVIDGHAIHMRIGEQYPDG